MDKTLSALCTQKMHKRKPISSINKETKLCLVNLQQREYINFKTGFNFDRSVHEAWYLSLTAKAAALYHAADAIAPGSGTVASILAET